jgi:CRISPR-associated protein Csd1
MLNALVQVAHRFQEERVLPPPGYKKTESIRWVIQITPEGEISQIEETQIPHARPDRQRSAKASEDNLKPYLLVDQARYALGIPEPRKREEAKLLHRGFRRLLSECADATKDHDLAVILQFLNTCASGGKWQENAAEDVVTKWEKIAPNDVVTFAVDRDAHELYPFERVPVQQFWVRHLEQEFVSRFQGQCASCGQTTRLLQTLPQEVVLPGQKCQITSFNREAFKHFGKDQTLNAPLCFTCGLTAAQTLNHLLKSETHRVILTRQNPRKGAQNPLRNQVAVFWLSRTEKARIEAMEIDLEAALASCLGDETPVAAAHLTQMEHFLRTPESGREAGLHLPDNAFYLAVLSANKARLVVREWIETSLEALRHNLRAWFDAQRIVGPQGETPRSFPVRRLVQSLYRDEDASEANPNLLRGLLRTAFTGLLPPHALMEAATQRFGILIRSKQDDKPQKREQRLGQFHALAATIKLVLNYGKGEAIVQETVDLQHQQPAYLCGRLLAILEEAQHRASRGRVMATLTDRFYGAVSSAPASAFTPLLRLAKTAHLPKLRKQQYVLHQEIDRLITEVMVKLDRSGGFPRLLPLRDQALFALGYYQQRAAFQSRGAAQ